MTKAYNRFLKQANSRGREYGDGFNSSHFENLSKHEKWKVIDILKKRAIEGDTVAINAIRFLGEGKAVCILEEVIAKADSLEIRAINQANVEAYKITKNSIYITNVLANLDIVTASEKWHCIQSLCSIDFSGDMSNEVRKVFDHLVLNEEDVVLRHSVAKKILQEAGILEGTPEYISKIANLVTDDINVRKKTLVQI